MVCVCVPFFLLIILLQTRAGMSFIKKIGSRADALFNGDRGQNHREQKMAMLAAKVHEEQKEGRRLHRFRRPRQQQQQQRNIVTAAVAVPATDLGARGGAGAGVNSESGGAVDGRRLWRWLAMWRRAGATAMAQKDEAVV